MSFPDHFSPVAATYATHRPRYPRELAQWLASIAPARGVVWEAGCGSGQLSALLGECFARVEATDASAAQLAHATPHPHVHYRVATAEASGLPPAHDGLGVHLAVAAQAAHWFDLARYYAEVRRVVQPGGAVALLGYGLSTITPAVDAVVHRLYAQTLGAFWPAERRHIESGYRTLDFPFEEITPPSLAMHADWALPDLLGYVDTWSALRRFEASMGSDALAQLRAEFAREAGAAWGSDPAARRAVRWEIAVRAGYHGN
ncbi:MAG TPA: class I SAM-dependent methyltransferase [Gemmatimonadaceae bacterium]